MSQKKTVLITGINGFLGSHLAKTLSKQYSIIGLELDKKNLHRIAGYNFKVYSSEESIENIFNEVRVTAVIHTATVYRINGNKSIEHLVNTNVLLPIKLYELAEKNNCELFLNTDTFFNNSSYSYSYLSDYTLSKRHALEWLKLIHKRCKLVNMKVFHMYGPDDSSAKFFIQMINALKNNVPDLDLTPGEQIRDFIFIEDVVIAYKTVLARKTSMIESFTEFQVGTSLGTSIKELVLLIKNLTNSNTNLNFGALPYRENEHFLAIADNSNLISLGWEPRISLTEGIKLTLGQSSNT